MGELRVDGADWVLLAGDESALPRIGALLEALPAGTPAQVFVEVPGAAEEQNLAGRVRWAHRDGGAPGAVLLEAVRTTDFPAGEPAVWLAGAADLVRDLSRYLVTERGVPARAIDTAVTRDDAPTGTPTPGGSLFDRAYRDRTAPWLIGAPQPAVAALAREGRIGGTVLDIGCGTGEHTILLAGLGYDVLGADASPEAVAQARENAESQGVAARFAVADALALESGPYHTILDSALFHIFDDADRARYVRSLHAACHPGGYVYVLALSDEGPSIGPEVSAATVREAFTGGWELEDLARTTYRGVTGPGTQDDFPAWLTRVRRL